MGLNYKLWLSAPFFILLLFLIFTWAKISGGSYMPTEKHYAALGFCLINLILYFIRFRFALIFTGIILILATANLLAFFVEIESKSFAIGIGGTELSTPTFQMKFFLLFIIYVILVLFYWRMLFKKNAKIEEYD